MSQLEGSSVEAQLIALYREREMLAEQLGITDAASLISMVRSLESQLRTFYEEREHGGGAAGGGGKGAAAQTADASLELQLRDLYAEREMFERELGTSGAESVIGMVRSLEAQLRALYQEKENASAEAAAIVEQIKAISNQLGRGKNTELVYESENGPSRWAVTWRNA